MLDVVLQMLLSANCGTGYSHKFRKEYVQTPFYINEGFNWKFVCLSRPVIILKIKILTPNMTPHIMNTGGNAPRGGSSHYTFRKSGCQPITIPKHEPIKKVYVEMVKRIVESEENNDEDIE